MILASVLVGALLVILAMAAVEYYILQKAVTSARQQWERDMQPSLDKESAPRQRAQDGSDRW